MTTGQLLHRPVQSHMLLEPLRRGIDYLLANQRADGAWTDYLLPIGVADQWVTGYVAFALSQAAACLQIPQLSSALDRAQAWLLGTRTFKRGWGYNQAAGADADSTAYVIRFLRSHGGNPDPDDARFLLEHFCDNGGARTYIRTDAWGRDHPDVTFAVFGALVPDERAARLSSLIDYMQRMRMEDGCWPAYWWRTNLYSTYLGLELLHDLDCDERTLFSPSLPHQVTIKTVFDLAFALGIAAFRQESAEVPRLLDALVGMQRQDGSWAGGANLGLTDRDCREPWREPRRTYYVDFRNTITTSSAIRVLTSLLRLANHYSNRPAIRRTRTRDAT